MKEKLLLTILFLLTMAGRASADELTVYDGESVDHLIPAGVNFWEDYTKSQVVIPATALQAMEGGTISSISFYTISDNIPYTSGCSADVYLKEVNYTSLSSYEPRSGSTLVYTGKFQFVKTDSGGKVTLTLSTPFTYDGANLLIGVENLTKAEGPYIGFLGQDVSGASLYGDDLDDVNLITIIKQRNFIPKTTFVYTPGAGVTCHKPLGLTVSDVTNEQAVMSWTSEADAFDLKVGDVVIENVTNPYTLTGLDAATTYNVQVRANCGGGDVSGWSLPVSFNTAACDAGNQGNISYELFDNYDDGWQAATIKIVHHNTGLEVATLNMLTGSHATGTVALCCGEDYDFVWQKGTYDSECSFVIRDISGDELFRVDDGSELTANAVFMAYTMNCTPATCLQPKSLALKGEPLSRSVTLSWTPGSASQTAWDVAYKKTGDADFTLVEGITQNPYTLTGLTPSSSYVVKVRGNCGGGDVSRWTAEVAFTTGVANPAPKNLTAETGTNKATVSWTGDSERYKVRYRKASEVLFSTSFEDDLPDGWTTIDSDGDGHDWDHSDAFIAHTGDGVAYSSSYDSDTDEVLYPDNWLITSRQPLGGLVSFWACGDDDTYFREHFAVYVSTTVNTSVGAFTRVSPEYVATSNFVKYSVDLSAYAGQEGYIAIRHYNCTDEFDLLIDDFTLTTANATPWTEVNTTGTSLLIEGLDEQTEYEYQVVSIVEGEADALSSIETFTTLKDNPIPFDVAVSGITYDGATITWSGDSDSYKVRYRSKPVYGDIFYENFESGMGQWTFAREGEGSEDTDWQVIDLVANELYGEQVPAHSGSHAAISRTFISGGDYYVDNWLISPKLTLGTELKYWVRGEGYFYDDYEVWLSTTTNDISSFDQKIRSKGYYPDEYWEQKTEDLSSYEGQQGYIAFRHTYDEGTYLLIDDVSITGLTVSGGEWQEVATSEKSIVLTDLQAGTDYEYVIIGVKGGVDNAGTPLATFTTTAAYELTNDGDNSAALAALNGQTVTVTLDNRTLYDNSRWNTLCLPFAVDLTEEGPLKGATAKTLSAVTVNGDDVTITFADAGTTLQAGKPYFVITANGVDINDPLFTDVTINGASPTDVVATGATLKGTYAPVVLTHPDKTKLYLMNNQLFWPQTGDATVNAFRAYIELSVALPDAPHFVLDMGDGATTNISTTHFTNADAAWYSLDGRKLNGMPTKKGVYIYNGKKVIK